MEILCTQDYSKFHLIVGNRPISQKRVEEIAELMCESGFIADNHIIVRPDGGIVDGQHRFEAAKMLAIPVYYTVNSQLTITNIRKMGHASKSWSYSDALNSHADEGITFYIRLIEVIRVHGFSNIQTLISLITNEGRVAAKNKFLDGTMAADENDWNFVAKVLNRARDFQAILGNKCLSQSFVCTIGLLSKTSFYDHERMMNKISYQAGKLRPATNVNEYLVILEDIYNYKATAKYAISFPRIHKRKI